MTYTLVPKNEYMLALHSKVTKSGSPTPREITPFIFAAKSKNFRIPDGFKDSADLDSSNCFMVSPQFAYHHRLFS